MRGTKASRDRFVHDERLGRVAHAGALRLGVDDDPCGFVEVGGRVDVDVAVAVAVDHDRYRRVLADAANQRGPPARDEAVDALGELHHLDGGLVRGVFDEQHAVFGQIEFGECVPERADDGDVGLQRARRAAEQRDIPRLHAQPGGVARDVGPVLVDDRDDAERDAHARDLQAVGSHPSVEHFAHRIGQCGDRAQAVGHALQARVAEAQPVERAARHATRGRGFDISQVRGLDLGRPLQEEVGPGEQGAVLGGRRRARQQPARRLGPPAQLRHARHPDSVSLDRPVKSCRFPTSEPCVDRPY